MKKLLLCLTICCAATGPLRAGPFSDWVLEQRGRIVEKDDANAAELASYEAFPQYKDHLYPAFRDWQHQVFFMPGDPLPVERDLLERAMATLETLFGPDDLAGTRRAVAAVLTLTGERGTRRRLDLFAQLCDIAAAQERINGCGYDFAQLTLQRMPPEAPQEIRQARRILEPYADAMARAADEVKQALRDGRAIDPEQVNGACEAVPQAAVAEVIRQGLIAAGCERMVYCARSPHRGGGHFYESIGYNGPSGEYTYATRGGRMAIWDLREDTHTDLLVDEGGAVRDPCVSWDGKKILFSYRRSGTHDYHLYTIDADGGNLTQLTDGEWNDIEPIWVPDGGIVFTSTRCHRWIPCFEAEVTNLHRCDADGSNIRMISSNVETETAPWMLPDGRIVYMRWEYTEKDRAVFHNLWTVNPDGTNHQILFGNEKTLPDVWNDPKPVPGTDQIVFVAHNHGGAQKRGHIGVVDQLGGPNDHRRIRYLTPPYRSTNLRWRDPFPVTKDLILAARGPRMVVIDQDGHEATIFELDDKELLLSEPRNLAPSQRPRELPHRTDYDKASGTFFISDVYRGRHMEGVKRGDVKDLLIIEELPKPIHHVGHTEPLMYNGTFMLERVLGTVPVEADGSVYFNAPPLRSLMFVLRDRDGLSIKRMQSFATLMPGEVAGCAGCHEPRTEVPLASGYPMALSRPPSEIRPFGDHVPDVYHYPRDIQPILDRNCLPCHSDEKRRGGTVLDGDMEMWFTQSYVTLQARDQIGVGHMALRANMPPRSIGSSASGLVRKMREGHHGVKPTPEEIETVMLWVDSAGVWAGTYGAVNTTHAANLHRDPFMKDLIQRRCSDCHKVTGYDIEGHVLLRTDSPNFGPDSNEKYGSRYNLSNVEKSLLLRAPLPKSAGGLGLCSEMVFKTRDDPDYKATLAHLTAKRDKALYNRCDVEGARPLPSYVREMTRQGLLPVDFDIDRDPWDPFALDRAFWESFWHRPAAEDK